MGTNPVPTVNSSQHKSIAVETTTKISDLPVKLVKEILSKVPLKYMRQVRLTCKQWDTLSKSRSFSKMHVDKTKSGESMMMIAMIDYNLYLMKVVLVANEDPIVELKGKLTCPDIQSKISRVFHCDGLLLCVLEDDATKVIVWNTYWGQTRSIECRYSHRPNGWDRWNYALGYEDNSSCRSYKFLRFIDKYYNAPIDQFSWYEIYDFESSTWKTIDVTPHWRILFGQRGASLNGNTYWPASQRNANDVLDDHIICFDYTSESFGPLLRLPFDAGEDDLVTLSCFREEKLAVLLSHNEAGPLEFDIWITTKIEADKVSWSKSLRVETEPGVFALVNCDSFFIDEERKVLMGYYNNTFNIVGEVGYLRKVVLLERADADVDYCRENVCSYVPSLVQIKKPAAGGGNRKGQSDLEKQRYDQNISRLAAIEKRSSL